MQELVKVKVGMIAVIAGIVGTMFAVGGIENSMLAEELFASIGVAVTSLMLMYVGVELVKDAV